MEQSRNLSIDFIKVVAMLGVMCLHTEICFYENPFAQCLYMSAVISIPLFFMVSGWLLYGKSPVGIDYSARKIWGILRFVLIISTFFWLVSGVRHGVPYLKYVFGGLLQKGGLYVFWYFGAMIILYALLPISQRIYKNYPRAFIALTAVLGILSNAIFAANFFGVHIENNTIQTFRLWNWLFYFNLGGLLRRYHVKSNAVLVISLFVANYLFQYFLTPMMLTVNNEYFYGSLPVMALCLFLFAWLSNVEGSKLKYIMGGADLFLPCYVFHIYVIGHTEPLFRQYVYSQVPFAVPLYWVMVAAITMALSWVVMKIPYMDRIFKI